MVCEIVELKFRGERRELFLNDQQLSLQVGDYVVVEADKGIDLGKVNHLSSLKLKDIENSELKKVVRKSTYADLQKYQSNRELEKRALEICENKIRKHQLDMKLVDCEYQLDANRITFHFTSDERVDFRQLVRDIAKVFRTRIELRQIGARDEARRVGGLGICGRKLCCSAWLRDFTPVTTEVAKEQNLPLTPSKLAGVCGRLKCCLMYERDFYNQAIKEYPELAKPITTEKGEGIVSNIDIFNEEIVVDYSDDSTETYSLDYLRDYVAKCDRDCGHSYGDLDELT